MIEDPQTDQPANRAVYWEALQRQPAWHLYVSLLQARRDQLVREIRQCLRKGDTTGALLKEVASSTLEDCLDLPKLEVANAQWTADQHEATMKEAMTQWPARTRSS